MFKRIIALLLTITVICSCFVYVGSSLAVAYSLDLNVLAVNCYSGGLSHGTTLSIQYSDATLGNNGSVKLYAQVKNNQTSILSSVIEVCELNYSSVERNAYSSATQSTAQNTMGVAQFTFPSSFNDYNADHYTVSVWSKDSSGRTSAVSNKSINDNFEGGSSNWSGVDSKKWLNYIDDSQLISQINLPGTHDSASVNFNFMTEWINKTQNLYIDQQLASGVRYLDIRVNTSALTLSDTSLSIGTTDYATCHSSYDAQNSNGDTYTLSQVLKSCYDFLGANPTEFIYFNVQQDNNRNDEAFQTTIKQFVAKNPDKWFVKSYNPTLGEVRGKIVYARRFEAGIDTDNVTVGGTRLYWDALENGNSSSTYVTGTALPSNGSIASQPHEIVYHIQDYYTLGASDKWTVAKRQLDNYCDSKPLNEYFLNCLNSGKTLVSPETSAGEINGNFSNYSMKVGKRYGWVVFDFVTEALARKVYSTNIKSVVASTSTANNRTILHYDFSNIDTDNIVKDLSGNGFDGKLANTSSITKSNDGYITLNNSGKKALNGAGIDIPSYAFRGTNDTVSISVYIKPTTMGKKTLFSMGNLSSQSSGYGTANNWLVAITDWDNMGPRFASMVKGCGEISYNATSTLTQGKWQLLTYIIDGNTLKIYKNSTLIGLYSGINASFDDVGNTVPISLGRATHWEDDDYIGAIGDFKIYNYAISTTDINNNYNQLAKVKAEVTVGNTVNISTRFSSNFGISSFSNWTSSNPSVATVSSGVVTGVSEGETTITAKSSNLVMSCVVTVKAKPNSGAISSTPTSSDTTSSNSNSSTIVDDVSSKTSSSVSSLETNNNSHQSSITSSNALANDIYLSNSSITLNIGGKKTVKAKALLSTGTLKWGSQNKRVATVTNGVIKGIAPGITKIKVTTDNSNIYKIVTVKVRPKKVTSVKAKKKSSNRYKITFKKQSKISGVQVYLKKGKGKFKLVKNGKISSYSTKKLKKGNYRVKIRAYKNSAYGKVYGVYSKSVNFKVK